MGPQPAQWLCLCHAGVPHSLITSLHFTMSVYVPVLAVLATVVGVHSAAAAAAVCNHTIDSNDPVHGSVRAGNDVTCVPLPSNASQLEDCIQRCCDTNGCTSFSYNHPWTVGPYFQCEYEAIRGRLQHARARALAWVPLPVPVPLPWTHAIANAWLITVPWQRLLGESSRHATTYPKAHATPRHNML